jgi:hypothetical protein
MIAVSDARKGRNKGLGHFLREDRDAAQAFYTGLGFDVLWLEIAGWFIGVRAAPVGRDVGRWEPSGLPWTGYG